DYTAATHARLLDALDCALPDADLVVLSDYCYGAATEPLVARLRERCAARGLPYLVDSKQLQRYPRLGATVITPNLLEAQLLAERANFASQLAHRPRQAGGARKAEVRRSDAEHKETAERVLREARRLARATLAAVETRWLALTLAEHGALLMERGGDDDGVHLPTHPVAHANVAGAGDSFISAMGLALAAGAAPLEAAQIGIEAASVAVTKCWTATVQHQELLQRVSLRDHTAHSAARLPATEAAARQALSALLARLARDRQAGRTIVFTNGVFDILHAGHVEFLRAAKALGDVLVVGINTDRSARQLKGERRPINSEADRLALVAALNVVDHVLLFDEETPTNLIRALRPHMHVKGADYEHAELPEAAAVHDVGGRVVLLPLLGDLSTTRVIERIANLSTGRSGASEVEVGA
ncbi:MAG TPA: D-glycero-beta-D-manno-heptose 1-phosphate adenylyltransferase, partial [Ktedonobacterales bacterium]|nr:D-glycero-beta-D-manno-heptose 1-phosphate adenylyltransferase [Ktedonobacterales bacterium]